jgi:tRNA splicing ligase
MLTHFFPDMAHVQNDNITGKRAAFTFEKTIMDHYKEFDIVYAGSYV